MVPLYVFYVSGRLRGGTDSDDLSPRVGPLKKDLTRAGGGEGGRGGERFRRPKSPGGSAKEGPHACGGRGGVETGWGGSGAVGSELRSELSGCGII